MTSLVRDLIALVYALGHENVKCVIGHDFGAIRGPMAALMRPDIFKRCITMSVPFTGIPPLPFNIGTSTTPLRKVEHVAQDIHKQLAELPEPRKHYKWYHATAAAADDWNNPRQGLESFLRGYIHLKSADWAGNKPHELTGWTASELAQIPTTM